MLQQVIAVVSVFLTLLGYLSAMQVASLKEIVTNKIANFSIQDPSSCVTTFTTLPHELSKVIIQRLNLINKSKSALPILLLSYKHYQQQQSNKKQNQLSLLLSNNQQVSLDKKQSEQLIQASAPIQNLIQDLEDHAEEIPLPLLTQEQVTNLLPYISVINALNASNSTLPMLQQEMPEIVGLSSYWIKHTAPQQIKEYLTAYTIPTLCDLIIAASYLDIHNDQPNISFIELATQVLGNKLLQTPEYQDEYAIVNTLPNNALDTLVRYLINNSAVYYALCGNSTNTIINTVQTAHCYGITLTPWSSDGKYAAKIDGDTIKILDAATGTCIRTLIGHTFEIGFLLWSPDGKHIANDSLDNTINIWDVTTGNCIHTMTAHKYDGIGTIVILSFSWSPDGKRIAYDSGNIVKVWDTSTGTCIHTLTGHTHNVRSVTWSPKDKYIASGSRDNTIRIWDTITGICTLTLNSVDPLSWSPDDSMIASGSRDNTVRVWNTATGTCIHTLGGHTGLISSVLWSPDGKYIASGSRDNTVRVWDAQNGAYIHILEGHIGWVESISWSPNGKHIASCSRDNTVRVWDANTGTCIYTLSDYALKVTSVSWSPDSKYIAGGSHNVVKIWNASTGTCIYTLEGHDNWVESVSWLDNGSMIASKSKPHNSPRIAKLWNIVNKERNSYLQSILSWEQALLLVRIVNQHDVNFAQDTRALHCYNSLDQRIKQLVEPLLSKDMHNAIDADLHEDIVHRDKRLRKE